MGFGGLELRARSAGRTASISILFSSLCGSVKGYFRMKTASISFSFFLRHFNTPAHANLTKESYNMRVLRRERKNISRLHQNVESRKRRKTMKKFAKIVTCAALALSCMASVACAEFKADKSITVISREEGSVRRFGLGNDAAGYSGICASDM